MQTYFQHVFFIFFIIFLCNFIYSVFVLKIGTPRLHQTAFSVPPPSAPNSTRKLVQELVSFSFFSWVWQLRSPNDQKAIGGCQLLALRFPWVIIAASACTRYTLHVELMSRGNQQQSAAAGRGSGKLSYTIALWLSLMFPQAESVTLWKNHLD